MKILIVGAGIGGLTLANFCQKNKIDFDLIEKEKDFSHHGFSLGMWSNGRDILKKLDLENLFDENCYRFRTINIENKLGFTIYSHNLDYFNKKYGSTYSHIRRADLISWLSSRLDKNKLYFNTMTSEIRSLDNRVVVTFSNGETKEYSLLVICDGVHSQTRDQFFKKTTQKKESNLIAWYSNITKLNIKENTISEQLGVNSMVTMFEEGKDKDLVVFVAKKIYAKQKGDDPRRIFSEHKNISYLFKNTNIEDYFKTELFRVSSKKFYQDRIVLLGDAAHAFEPFGGLGASMAMEDAYVLVQELVSCPNIKVSLKNYQSKRMKRVNLARKITSRMQFWTTLRNPFLKIFELTLPILPKFIFIDPYNKLFKEKI